MKICQANRLHVTKSAVQVWAESLTYAWHMAVLDHRFPPEAMPSTPTAGPSAAARRLKKCLRISDGDPD